MMDGEARRIWDVALGQLQLQVTRPNYDTWLKDTVGLQFDNGRFVIGTHSDFACQWLTTKMGPLIAKTISDIVGKPLEVSFELITTASNEGGLAGPLFQAGDGAKPIPASPKPRLNHKFTFERFVVGDSNHLALTAALTAANQPGQVYNPLVIYGPLGLGKTHLLHAIAHRAHQRGLRLIYASAEQFTNEFVTALAQGRLADFRHKYRTPDLLLIDDIHFLAGKERTQEEFFYTFNDLHAAAAQIVISADRRPQAMTALDSRLRSRLQWGLIAQVQPPNLETRLAILKAKALELAIPLPPDVSRLIAERLQDNVRDLEGCLTHSIAVASLRGSAITEPIALEAIAAFTAPPQPRPPSPNAIVNAVATYFNLTIAALASPSRLRPITDARHIAMFLLREDSNQSLTEIGHLLGHRDHSTVIHAYQKIARAINRDQQLQGHLTEIRTLIAKAS